VSLLLLLLLLGLSGGHAHVNVVHESCGTDQPTLLLHLQYVGKR
jgi:hypothetical protein